MTSNHALIGIVFTSLLLICQSGWAEQPGRQIVMHGNTHGATACATCHGEDGAGQAAAGFPRLAGQNKDYLLMQLHAFVQGSRNNPIMAPIAKALSQQEMTAVTAYYAGRQTPNPNAGRGDKTLRDEGKKLALRGNWDKTIPACVACHGSGGNGVGRHFPALAGQGAQYIEQQINAWKSATRHNDPNQLMQGVAQRLSQAETRAVAAYFASLPANKK